YKRMQQGLHRQQNARCRVSNALGPDGGQGFRRHFGKNQHHQGKQNGVYKDGQVGIIGPQALADDGSQSGSGKVNQVITGKNGTDQTIGLFQQFGGAHSALVLVFRQMPQPVPVQ